MQLPMHDHSIKETF